MYFPSPLFFPIRRLIAGSLFLGTCTLSIAQDAPPPSNTAALLKELDQIASGAKSKGLSRRSAAISQMQAACSSGPAAVEYLANALNNTKYQGRPQDFAEWRRKNQDVLLNLSYQEAAMLQLRYLLMALQRSEKLDAYAQVTDCLAYLNNLAGHNLRYNSSTQSEAGRRQKGGSPPTMDKLIPAARETLNQSLADSPVVQWLQIGDLLPDNKDFAASGGNYESVLDKNVRAPLRKKHDQRLLSTWDNQIAAESAIANASQSKQQIDDFNQNRAPELLFKKAQDTVQLDQPSRALGEMLVLIRNYPSNSSLNEWISTARTLLTNKAAQITAETQTPTQATGAPVQAPTTNPPVTSTSQSTQSSATN